MIRVDFFARRGALCGFCIEGHAMAGEAGRDIVCAAVSSAAYMAANTVTEVQKLPAEAIAEDAKLRLLLEPGQEEAAAPVLAGLRLHLKMLSQQYPKAIKVYDSEV